MSFTPSLLLAASLVSGETEAIRLLVRSDDMGAAHAINAACLQSVTQGIARSVEVIVPGPWFREAVKLLQAHPEIDVGVHLDLTSEWDLVKWGPVAQNVPSIVDGEGRFYPMTRQRSDFPPHTGFLECGWRIEEVERELRSQIELALEQLPNVTHLSAHMATATSTPELRRLVEGLSVEYELPLGLEGARRFGSLGGSGATPEEKEKRLIEQLEGLEPGLWLLVVHPGLDTPELRAYGHRGYEQVAADRQGTTDLVTSPRVKEVVVRRRIELVSYGDILGERTDVERRAPEDSREKRVP